jgi:fructose-1,6-bisphosphatase-3
MMPLASFAMDVYRDDPCTSFLVKNIDNGTSYTAEELSLIAKMHKAITIIQLKLEGQIIMRRPEFDMNDRLLLDKIDIEKGFVGLSGRKYKLNDTNFPTLNSDLSYELTSKEQGVLEQLLFSFKNSRKLQEHIRFLYSNGSLYLCSNGNLLYHGCIAIDENGDFISFTLGGKTLSGKGFLDHIDSLVRKAYFSEEETDEKLEGMDMISFIRQG